MSPLLTLVNNGNVTVEAQTSEKTPAKSAVLHRSLHSDPHRVVQAKGNYLHLSNGQKIFDATGGAAVACLGHGDDRCVSYSSRDATRELTRTRLQKAVMKQMDEVSYCHSLFYATSAAEELAKSLIDSTNGEMARVFVVSSGESSISFVAS